MAGDSEEIRKDVADTRGDDRSEECRLRERVKEDSRLYVKALSDLNETEDRLQEAHLVALIRGSKLAEIKREAEKIREHAWLMRFRKANYSNKYNELSPDACRDIADYVDKLLDLATSPALSSPPAASQPAAETKTINGLEYHVLECNGTFSIRAEKPPCPLLTEDGQWAQSFGESKFHRWPTREAAEEAARKFGDK